MPSSKRYLVNVSVTFTSCKIGGNPNPRIEQPQALSDIIGPIRVDQFDLLKSRLKEIALDTSHAFFSMKIHAMSTHLMSHIFNMGLSTHVRLRQKKVWLKQQQPKEC